MRILIVEDDEMTADFIKKILENENHEIQVATDGLSGFKMASSNGYDAIVLDVRLPLMNGIDVCLELRRKRINTPILILSSETSEQSRVSGLDAGADDYLVKPFSYVELQARIRAITRRPSTVVQSRLQVGDLRLEPDTRVVKRAGKVIDLRPKEYALLEYLMRNQETALYKHQILSDVWNVGRYNTSNRLEACIKQLRVKIDKPFDTKLIKTVRNIGYKVTAE